MAESNAPDEAVQKGLWSLAARVGAIFGSIAVGLLIGRYLWGDAPALREQIAIVEDEASTLRFERNNLERALGACQSGRPGSAPND